MSNKFRIKEIQAKSIIGTTKVPSADYVINPYTGCQFGCMYCFASFMGRFVGENNKDWGNYVYVKANAPELIKKDILRLMKKDPHPKIAISTVTDPYQGVEKKYKLTSSILETFAENNYQGRVSILTKSPMVLKDLTFLKKIPNAEVGITITTSDDKLSRFLEVRAPSASTRLKTLKTLNDSGIKTYVFVGPFLPHMKYKPELIDKLFSEIKAAGTDTVKLEFLNLPPYVKSRMKEVIAEESPEIQEMYKDSQSKNYREELEPIIKKYLKKYGLKMYYDEIVHHVGNQELIEN
ncbi:MAG: radical SAM protein [Crocinitomix sp.]|nr:radical SAM protein [Crocinitomix sp.]